MNSVAMLAGYFLFHAVLIAMVQLGRAELLQFLEGTPAIRDERDLLRFKTLVRRNMRGALVYLVLGTTGATWSIYLVVTMGALGTALALAIHISSYFHSKSVKKLEKRARSLNCPDERFREKYLSVGNTWVKRALPNFESETHARAADAQSRLALLGLYFSGVLLAGGFWLGGSFWSAWRFDMAEREAKLSYSAGYQRWLAADTETLLQELIRVRGPDFSERGPGKLQAEPRPIGAGTDVAMSYLLARPDHLAAMDFHAPRKFVAEADIRMLIGEWRCREDDDSLHAKPIGSWLDPEYRFNRGPKVSCSALTDALVLREGTPQGDWLFHLPESKECRWLYLDENDEQCAGSLQSWLAASVIGASSRWDRLIAEEPDLARELLERPALSLREGIEELREAIPHGLMDQAPDISAADFVPAGDDYRRVLQELGDARPAIILAENQTHRAVRAYSRYTALVRLWDGTRFSSIRLRPHDYENAVVVVAQRFGGQMVLQIGDDGRGIYVDLNHRRAFLRFKDWIDWGRAQERVWYWNGRKFGPNPAWFPIG